MWGSDAEGPSLLMAAGRVCCRQSSFPGETRAGEGAGGGGGQHLELLTPQVSRPFFLAMTMEGRECTLMPVSLHPALLPKASSSWVSKLWLSPTRECC